MMTIRNTDLAQKLPSGSLGGPVATKMHDLRKASKIRLELQEKEYFSLFCGQNFGNPRKKYNEIIIDKKCEGFETGHLKFMIDNLLDTSSPGSCLQVDYNKTNVEIIQDFIQENQQYKNKIIVNSESMMKKSNDQPAKMDQDEPEEKLDEPDYPNKILLPKLNSDSKTKTLPQPQNNSVSSSSEEEKEETVDKNKSDNYEALLNFRDNIEKSLEGVVANDQLKTENPQQWLWKITLDGKLQTIQNLDETELGDAKDKGGNNILHIAALSFSSESNIFLLSNVGAYLEYAATNNTGIHPLHIAAFLGNKDFITRFIETIDTATQIPALEIALYSITKNKQDDQYKLYASPPHTALLNKQFDVFEKLTQQYPCQDHQNITGIGNVFHLAILLNAPDLLKKLYDHFQKSDLINAVDNNKDENKKRTPFCLAAERGYIDCMEVFFELFRHNEDKFMDTYTVLSFTPLYLAALSNQHKAIKYLTDKNVYLDIYRSCGKGNDIALKTASQIAQEKNHLKVFKLINFHIKKIQNEELKIKNLVFINGDASNISYIGALSGLTQTPEFSKNLTAVLGYSLQSLLATFVALGVDFNELPRLFSQEIFPKLWIRRAESGAIFNSLTQKNIGELNKHLTERFHYTLGQASYDDFANSLLSLDELHHWLNQKIRALTGEQWATFGDLQELRRDNEEKYKHLYIPVRRLDRGDIYVLNSESDDHQDYIIADAVIAACSIPVLYGSHSLGIRRRDIARNLEYHADSSHCISVAENKQYQHLTKQTFAFYFSDKSPTQDTQNDYLNMGRRIFKQYEESFWKESQDNVNAGHLIKNQSRDRIELTPDALFNTGFNAAQQYIDERFNIKIENHNEPLAIEFLEAAELTEQFDSADNQEIQPNYALNALIDILGSQLGNPTRDLENIISTINNIYVKQQNNPLSTLPNTALGLFEQTIPFLFEQKSPEEVDSILKKFFIQMIDKHFPNSCFKFYKDISLNFYNSTGDNSYIFSAYYAHYALLFLRRDNQNNELENTLFEQIGLIEKAYIKKNINNDPRENRTINYTSLWKGYYDELKKIRNQAKRFIENPQEIPEGKNARTYFHEEMLKLIQEIVTSTATTITKCYGAFPRDFCVLGLGSIASKCFSIYSDIDIGLLIGDIKASAIFRYEFLCTNTAPQKKESGKVIITKANTSQSRNRPTQLNVRIIHASECEETFTIEYSGEINKEEKLVGEKYRELKQLIVDTSSLADGLADDRLHPSYTKFLELLAFIFTCIGETVIADQHNIMRAGTRIDAGDFAFLHPRRHEFYFSSAPANQPIEDGVYFFFEQGSWHASIKIEETWNRIEIPADSSIQKKLNRIQQENNTSRKIFLSQSETMYVLSLFKERAHMDELKGGYMDGMMFLQPEDMGRRWSPSNMVINREHHAIHHTVSLYEHNATEREPTLHKRYTNFLANEWKNHAKPYGLKSLEKHQGNAVKEELLKFIKDQRDDFDIKKCFLRPLTLWITDVSLLIEERSGDYAAFFGELKRYHCNEQLVDDIQQLLEIIWLCRAKYSLGGKVHLDPALIGESREVIYFKDLTDNEKTDLLYYAQTLVLPLVHSADYFKEKLKSNQTIDFSDFHSHLFIYQEKIVNDIKRAKPEISQRLEENQNSFKERYNPQGITTPTPIDQRDIQPTVDEENINGTSEPVVDSTTTQEENSINRPDVLISRVANSFLTTVYNIGCTLYGSVRNNAKIAPAPTPETQSKSPPTQINITI